MALRESQIDYKNNYFEYPELTPILGELTTAVLLNLHSKVRSNAQSVDCTLGGGANGHLGLVCSMTTYASIPGTAVYTHPTNPAPLVMPIRATQYQIAQVQDQYEE
eukprot:3268455-Ditylum_brightwellii.AAC.1